MLTLYRTGKRCRGVTRTGERCKRRWFTFDPGLSRQPYYCEQHQHQRETARPVSHDCGRGR